MIIRKGSAYKLTTKINFSKIVVRLNINNRFTVHYRYLRVPEGDFMDNGKLSVSADQTWDFKNLKRDIFS